MRLMRAILFLCLVVLPVFAQTSDSVKFDISAVDKSVDRCTDFYQYACGGWLRHNPVPSDRPYWAVFQQMRELNDQRVRRILESAAASSEDKSPEERKIGDYFASCMDEKTIEVKALEQLRPELNRIAALERRDDLAREVAHLHQLGSDAGFAMGADQRLGDASETVAYLDQSQLNLPEPGYYTSGEADSVKARAGYHAHVERIFALLGQSPEQATRSADDVLRIETALAAASLSPLERRDRKAWYHEMSLAQLTELAPAFPWKAYFDGIDFQPTGILNVAVPGYMQVVNRLLQTTTMPAWKNYLQWELVRVVTPALPEKFRQAEFAFYSSSLRGVKQQDSRTRQCDDLTNRDLGEAIGKRYVELYFPAETRQRVLEMVSRLRTALEQDFQEISWMTPGTRKEARQKLDLLRAMIGYPDHWRDYSSLTVKRGDALGNALRAQEFEFHRQINKIGRPVDRGEFYELVQGVEGYHDNPINVIVFTAGILQPPFFDPDMDDAINFGLAGGVIGHELTHAFDDKGHLFDGEGNMRNWWTMEDGKDYEQRAACFVKQYSQYTAVDDIKVNGELTLGENIADNGGLQLAYKAFESRPQGDAGKIGGFTPEQRFFLGWAQWRCMNETEKTARVLARTDPHSPGRWRVNGVVSNMPGFAAAYQCKTGDPMVNRQPCRLW